MTLDVAQYARNYTSLGFAVPEAGILELVLSNAGRLKAASKARHRELDAVWLAIDCDDSVRAVLARGEGADFAREGISP